MSKTTATKKEDMFLRKNYLTMTYGQIEKALGRSSCFVSRRMKQLGLNVPDEILKKHKAKFLFVPGQKPHNTGKKQIEWMSSEAIEKSKASCFKKGNVPYNTAKSDGAISVRKDTQTEISYKYIRVSIGKWELLQRKVWADAHGPIDKGMVIIFKDGNSLNCELSNLQMITLAENMLRNSIQRFPPELKTAIRSVSKLKRIINKKLNSNE
jgi:hypothetical protein